MKRRSPCAERLLRAMLRRREDLDLELAPCIVSGAGFGPTLKHPLVVAVPYLRLLNALYNAQLQQKRERLRKAEATAAWDTYIWLHERPFRWEAFCTIRPRLRDAEYWRLLGRVWIDSENLYQVKALLPVLLEAARPRREQLMNHKERAALAALPQVFRIYRGCETKNRNGWSWTLDVERATWFSGRFGQSGGVIRGKISKRHVIALFLSRQECEVVVNPKNVQAPQDLLLERGR